MTESRNWARRGFGAAWAESMIVFEEFHKKDGLSIDSNANGSLLVLVEMFLKGGYLLVRGDFSVNPGNGR